MKNYHVTEKIKVFCYRNDYTKAKEQLEKGGSFVRHLMKIMDMQPWKYVGFVCFPNLENRKALQVAEVVNDEDELKVFIKTIDTFNCQARVRSPKVQSPKVKIKRT